MTDMDDLVAAMSDSDFGSLVARTRTKAAERAAKMEAASEALRLHFAPHAVSLPHSEAEQDAARDSAVAAVRRQLGAPTDTTTGATGDDHE